MTYKFYRKKPYAIQLRALEKALELDASCALWMDPGTGKTRVVIDFCGMKYEEGRMRHVLVVGPLASLRVWEDEIKNWLPRRIPRRVIRLDLLDGRAQEKAELISSLPLSSDLTFLLVNYDMIGRRVRKSSRYITPIRDAIKTWYPDVIVADESHLIKHHTSRRSKAMDSLARLPHWRFCLSGTPITNSPLDVFAQYRFLDGTIFGRNWGNFKYRYALWGGFGGFKLLRYMNQEELAVKLNSIAVRATIDELGLETPVEQPLFVVPTQRTMNQYKKMEKQFLLWLEQAGTYATAGIVLTQLLRCSQITGGFVRDVNGEDIPVGTEKLRMLEDLLNTYAKEGGEQIVVFARFRWELAQIESLCQKMKLPYVRFNDESDAQSFGSDPNIKVFVSQIAKGGISINDLVVSRIGIFYSMDYSSDHIRQAEGRLHRSGQTKKPLFLFLLMNKTLDLSMWKAYRDRRDLATLLVDDWRNFVRGKSK